MGFLSRLKKNDGGKAAAAAPAPAAQAPPPAAAAPPPPKTSDTVEALERQRARLKTLEGKIAFYSKRIDDETEKAKAALAKGDKRTAQMCLMQKKNFTQQKGQLEQSVLQLQEIVFAIESQSNVVDQAQGIEDGATFLKQQNAAVAPEKVENIMENMQEQVDAAKETQAVMNQFGPRLDDDYEIADDLAAMEAELAQEKIAAAPAAGTAKLPAQAQASAASATAAAAPDEDEELKALAAQLAM